MRPVRLEGPQVVLEELGRDADLKRYLGWVNDGPTTRFMEIGARESSMADLQEYVSTFDGRDDRYLLAIRDRVTGEYLGNITLQGIDARNGSGEIGILIGEPEARGRGIGTEAIGLVTSWAFQELSLHRVHAGVVDGNEPSLRAFLRNGFEVEGRLREAFLLDGEYLDAIKVARLNAGRDTCGETGD